MTPTQKQAFIKRISATYGHSVGQIESYLEIGMGYMEQKIFPKKDTDWKKLLDKMRGWK
jgi:hypothetical protein